MLFSSRFSHLTEASPLHKQGQTRPGAGHARGPQAAAPSEAHPALAAVLLPCFPWTAELPGAFLGKGNEFPPTSLQNCLLGSFNNTNSLLHSSTPERMTLLVVQFFPAPASPLSLSPPTLI